MLVDAAAEKAAAAGGEDGGEDGGGVDFGAEGGDAGDECTVIADLEGVAEGLGCRLCGDHGTAVIDGILV